MVSPPRLAHQNTIVLRNQLRGRAASKAWLLLIEFSPQCLYEDRLLDRAPISVHHSWRNSYVNCPWVKLLRDFDFLPDHLDLPAVATGAVVNESHLIVAAG